MKTKFGPRTRGEVLPLVGGSWNRIETTARKNQASTVITLSGTNPLPPGSTNGDVMHDIVTREFRKKQARGEIINNPMDRSVTWAEITQAHSGLWVSGVSTNPTPTTGTIISQESVQSNWLPQNLSMYPSASQRDISYVMREAINEAYANAHQRNVMGLVDIAEMGKTYDMIRTNLGRLESVTSRGLVKTMMTKSVRKSRKGPRVYEYKSKSPLGHLYDLAGLHLEVNYGVIPLMLSLQGLVKTLTTDTSSPGGGLIRTFRGSDSLTVNDEFTNVNHPSSTYWDGGKGMKEIYTVTISQNQYARAGVMTKYKPSIKAMLGLEIRDIVPGLYELIPLSFVVDWAFNLNSYLEAVTPVRNFKSEASWVTTHNEVVLQYAYERPQQTLVSTPNKWRADFPYVRTEFVSGFRFSRRTPGVVPLPPKFNNDLESLTHFISGAAIGFSKLMNSRPFRKALTM